MSKSLKKNIRGKIFEQIDKSVWNGIIGYKVWEQVRIQVEDQIFNQGEHQLSRLIEEEIWDQFIDVEEEIRKLNRNPKI